MLQRQVLQIKVQLLTRDIACMPEPDFGKWLHKVGMHNDQTSNQQVLGISDQYLIVYVHSPADRTKVMSNLSPQSVSTIDDAVVSGHVGRAIASQIHSKIV